MTFIESITNLLVKGKSRPGNLISCPICKKKLKYSDLEAQQIIICKKCELGVTAPPPEDMSSTDAIWEIQYRQNRETRRAQWIQEAVKRLDWMHLWTSQGTILEIGCGFGEFLEVATNMGHDSFGIEPSPSGKSRAEKSCNAIVFSSFNEWKLNSKDLTVDAIAAWHSIEHIKDPISILKYAHKILHKDGYFFAEIPNLSCGHRKKYMGDWEHANLQFHYYHYSAKSIEKLFSMAGFKIIHILEITPRIYSNHVAWKSRRNTSLIQDDQFPDNELLRIVAQKL